uniref:Uncharacterized protein n=1 Tax=Anguilla anguilla TaxID=7936 RepID=A0A0E9VJC0_ANGAN
MHVLSRYSPKLSVSLWSMVGGLTHPLMYDAVWCLMNKQNNRWEKYREWYRVIGLRNRCMEQTTG